MSDIFENIRYFENIAIFSNHNFATPNGFYCGNLEFDLPGYQRSKPISLIV